MRKYTLFSKIWRLVYPALIFVGVQFVVMIIFFIFYFIYLSVSGFNENLLEAVIYEIISPIMLLSGTASSILLFYIFKYDKKYFPENPQKFRASIYIMFSVFGICLSLSIGLLLSLLNYEQLFPDYEEHMRYITEGNKLFNAIATVILAPISEELCFRGIIFKRARTHFGLPAAVIVSSLLFGIVHLHPLQIIYAGVLGIIMALAYHYSGKIIVPILMHAGFNSLSLLADIFAEGTEILQFILVIAGITFTIVFSILVFKKIPFWKYKNTELTPLMRGADDIKF